MSDPSNELLHFAGGRRFGTILADPPWRFQNRTGKMAPEHRRLNRYGTMTLDDILKLPVPRLAADVAHLYLWVPNALLPDGIRLLEAWGFKYKVISFGIRFGRTAGRTVGALAFTFAM